MEIKLNLIPATPEQEELIKATKDKRSDRDTSNSLENLLTEWLATVASDPTTVQQIDSDGNILVCREQNEEGNFGWSYESLPQDVRDTVDRRAAKADTTKERNSRSGWEGVRNPLQKAAKSAGLSLRFVYPSGENADSEPFKQSLWNDTPSFGDVTFRQYNPRKRRTKEEIAADEAANNGGIDTDAEAINEMLEENGVTHLVAAEEDSE
jgi:hypothetical protein